MALSLPGYLVSSPAKPGISASNTRSNAADRSPCSVSASALAIADLIGGGIAAADALASATSLAAQACGLGDRKGRLHPGYDADLAVVDGDPLADIASLTAVRAVYLGGRAAQPAT